MKEGSNIVAATSQRACWNKGKTIEVKPLLRPKHVRSIRTKLKGGTERSPGDSLKWPGSPAGMNRSGMHDKRSLLLASPTLVSELMRQTVRGLKATKRHLLPRGARKHHYRNGWKIDDDVDHHSGPY
jgi:hypothetical protein